MNTIDKIIMLLEKNKKTQKELTDWLGLDKSTFSAWKNGKSQSYNKYLSGIASFLNVSTDYLLDNEEFDETDDDLVILNRNAKKLPPENRKLLIDMAKAMLKEEFNDN
ncbi:MAG: helix-turn-helix transcriptional regulator [Ruminococcus sp.]|nr:helix-turn-helix transcriptional regulator [Ruminococcus sp.]